MALTTRHIGLIASAALVATFAAAPPALAADGEGPKVSIRTPRGHYVLNGMVPVSFVPRSGDDLADMASVSLYANGTFVGIDTTAPWGIDWDTRAYSGVVRLRTETADLSGDTETWEDLRSVDKQAPTGLTVRFPATAGYVGQGGELGVDAEDDLFVYDSELLVNGKPVDSSGPDNLDLRWNTRVANGPATMTVRVRDQAGNPTDLTRTVTVDNDRPVATVAANAGGAVRGDLRLSLTGYRDQTPLRSFAGTLARGNVTHGFGSGPGRSLTYGTRHLPDGHYTLGWHVQDAAGNIATARRALTVDNHAPTVSITKAPKNRARAGKKFTVTAKATDPYGVARVQLLVNGKVAATDTTAGYRFTVNPKKYGKKFTVRLRAYDKAGNVRYSVTRTYRR